MQIPDLEYDCAAQVSVSASTANALLTKSENHEAVTFKKIDQCLFK